MVTVLPLFFYDKTDSKTDIISIFYAQVFLKNTVAELKISQKKQIFLSWIQKRFDCFSDAFN